MKQLHEKHLRVNKKKMYRGNGRKNRKEQTFTILLLNLRGFQSKKHSLNKVITKLKPSMMALNETQLTGRMKVAIESYTCW